MRCDGVLYTLAQGRVKSREVELSRSLRGCARLFFSFAVSIIKWPWSREAFCLVCDHGFPAPCLACVYHTPVEPLVPTRGAMCTLEAGNARRTMRWAPQPARRGSGASRTSGHQDVLASYCTVMSWHMVHKKAPPQASVARSRNLLDTPLVSQAACSFEVSYHSMV